jgi:hypothetical protein
MHPVPFFRVLAGLACLLASAVVGAEGARILAHSPVEIVASRADAGTRLELQLEGSSLSMLLEPNAELLASLQAPEREAFASRGELFMRGSIEGIDASWVRLSRLEGRWSGVWWDGTELFLLDPTDTVRAQLKSNAGNTDYVAYRLSDIDMPSLLNDAISLPSYALGTKSARTDYARFARHLAVASVLDSARPKGSPVRQMRVTIVTDTEFTGVHAGNRDGVVASRINAVDGIYSDQFQTRIVVGELRHLSDNGTLNTTVVSGGDTLLTRFLTYMVSGAGSNIPKGGVNHLFSGKNFDGNTLGVAYVGVLCNSSFGYGINEVRAANTTSALVIAHEMGHNFGASHDGQVNSPCVDQTGSWLMSQSINGSSEFSPCSRNAIVPRINAATCFTPVTSVPSLFSNGFE